MIPLRWGIMGTGGIAATMAGVLRNQGATVTCVGSERPGAAEEFAAAWDIPNAAGSHREVAEDPGVDVVYVATTNDRHHDNVKDCVRAGKAALCEKPLALNAGQARSMFVAAREAGTFLMEALWMRFLPFVDLVERLLGEGVVGEPRHVAAVFGFPAPDDPARRWMSGELGGGALLDLGVYPLSLVHHLLGPPRRFEAQAQVASTGVDLTTQVLSEHDGGVVASVTATFAADLVNEAVIAGREGRLRIHAPFHHSPLVTLERRGEVIDRYDTSYPGHGFRFEVAEVVRCLAAGLVESPRRPAPATLEVLEWMDAIRSRCGVVFPGDTA